MTTFILATPLEGALADAFDRAAGQALTSRAAFARRLLSEALRASGHLPPLPAPRHVARTRETER